MWKINKEVKGGCKITKQISLSLKVRMKSKEICKAGDKNLNKAKQGNIQWFHQNDSHNIHWLREKVLNELGGVVIFCKLSYKHLARYSSCLMA